MSSVFKQGLKRAKEQEKHTKESIFEKEISDQDKAEEEEVSNTVDSDEEMENNQEEIAIKTDEYDDKDDQQDKKEEIEDEDPENELRAFKDPEPHTKEWKNRQRTLIISSRGIKGFYKQLMDDIMNLVPNTKKESKVERKEAKLYINHIAMDRSCNNFLFFEQRKRDDLYMWASKTPNGPSIKFQVLNVHCSDELKLTGNCLKYSRPLVSFDKGFNASPHLQLMKEMLLQIFNTPKNHPKSKPFIDHVLSFNYLNGKIWFRCYQILNQYEEKFTAKDDIEKLVLIEIGPRFCLQPIKIFNESFGGEALWQNQEYIAPTKLRSKKFIEFSKKRDDKAERKKEKKQLYQDGQDSDGYLEANAGFQ